MEFATKIVGKNYQKERSLFRAENALFSNCKFSGKEDGESPLKETKNITVENCVFDLRYPLWHTTNAVVRNCSFSDLARAPFWYDENVKIIDTKSKSIKPFRECKNLELENSIFEGDELFWKIAKITANSCKFSGFYGFFQCKDIKLNNIEFSGKYSFQYCRKFRLENSKFDTKDAFWHSSGGVIKNCVIKGEYIAWYSSNLTFIDCTIESHQPFCHAKNLKFINCKMPNSDLAFEDSTVKGNFVGKINSILTPKRARIRVDKVGKLVGENNSHNILILENK